MGLGDEEEETLQLKEQLRLYRSTLAHYRRQQAQHSLAFAPPIVTHGITEARQNIKRIKQSLRNLGTTVEDQHDDEEEEKEEYPKSDKLPNKSQSSPMLNAGKGISRENPDALLAKLLLNQVTDSIDTKEPVPNITSSLPKPIQDAQEPIGCAILLASILLIWGLLTSSSNIQNWFLFALNVMGIALISITIGLGIGLLFHKIAPLSLNIVPNSVWGSILLGGVASVVSIYTNQKLSVGVWFTPTFIACVIGGSLGALFGPVSSSQKVQEMADEMMDAMNKVETEAELWEKAEKIALDKFKQRHTVYNWTTHKLEVITFKRYPYTEEMTVMVYKDYEFFDDPVGRYYLEIDKNGDIRKSQRSPYIHID